MIPAYNIGTQRHPRPSYVRKLKTHLYDGDVTPHLPLGRPLCAQGYTDMPDAYSYRVDSQHISPMGVCRDCAKRALEGKHGVTIDKKRLKKVGLR